MIIPEVAKRFGFDGLAALAKLKLADVDLDCVKVSEIFRRCGIADTIATDISNHDARVKKVDASNCEFVLLASKDKNDNSVYIYVRTASTGIASMDRTDCIESWYAVDLTQKTIEGGARKNKYSITDEQKRAIELNLSRVPMF